MTEWQKGGSLERAVEKKHAGLADEAPHLGMIHIFVDHNTLQNAAVLDLAAGDFLDFCVAFDVDIRPSVLQATKKVSK